MATSVCNFRIIDLLEFWETVGRMMLMMVMMVNIVVLLVVVLVVGCEPVANRVPRSCFLR